MKTLATLVLGIFIGVAGLLIVQHPGSIDIMRGAFGVTPASPPVIIQSPPTDDWCAVHSPLPCK